MVHPRNGSLGRVPLGESGLGFVIQDHVDHVASKERIFRARSFGRTGLGFVIQDHTDHGASKERIFRALSFGRIQIRICDPTSRRSRCMKGTKFKASSQRIPKSALF